MHLRGCNSLGANHLRMRKSGSATEIEMLSREHEPKDLIICVSHADPIRLAVAYFVGLPLDLFQRLYIAPASFTVLEIREGGSRLLTLNYEISFTLPRA